jgi:tight adherence protein B
VLDRVAETIRGRMELRRLVQVLTAQARISRWILTNLPIFLLVALTFTGGDYLDAHEYPDREDLSSSGP